MRLRDRRSSFLLGDIYSRWVAHNTFRLFWIVLVIWYELGIYHLSLFTCTWPVFGGGTERPSHVLLLSDTQVINAYRGEGIGQVRSLRRFLVDLNLRKNWRITSRLKPDAVVFLGDMLASGGTLRSAEYERAAHHFKSIFMLPNTPMYFIPGNIDVSLGRSKRHSKHLKAFFSHSFGPLNQSFSIHNHTFVGLDAPGLVDEDYKRSSDGFTYDDWAGWTDGPVAFVRSVQSEDQPLILLSHVPLSRPTTASCGPLREKGTINRNVGNGFQSMLGKDTTQFLLRTLRPSLIFSGDNRDYCEYTHSYTTFGDGEPKRENVREVTVKSFSMSRHIRLPGFQLLSLVNPSSRNESSFADRACLLPDQGRIYSTIYPAALLVTIVVLTVVNKTKARRQLPTLHLSPQNGHGNAHGALSPYADGNPWTPLTARTPISPFNHVLSASRNNTLNGHRLRASLASTSPNGSPPRHYIASLDDQDEEEALYSTHSPHGLHAPELQSHGKWTSDREEALANTHSRDGDLPGWKPVDTQKWSWSWTFAFNGRRRQVSLTVPSRKSLDNCFELCGVQIGPRPRRGLIATTVLNMASILWPALLVWFTITWFHF